MPRAITYAILITSILVLMLVAFDMHDRKTGPFANKAKPETVTQTDKNTELKSGSSITNAAKQSMEKTGQTIQDTTSKMRNMAKQVFAKPDSNKAEDNTNDKHEISVDIKGKRSSKGQIIAVLYDDAIAFGQDRYDQAVRTTMISTVDFKDQLQFHGLGSGKYALVVIHDENNNNRFDQSSGHIEGYGYSNNVGKVSPASFNQAAFEVNGNKQLSISLIYH